MPTIYDNIDTPFFENEAGNGLKDALKLSHKGDFCVGYFNLRGWKSIDQTVASWPKAEAPPCRLLVGMQRLPQEELNILVNDSLNREDRITNKRVAQLKRKIAGDFQKQLTIGAPILVSIAWITCYPKSIWKRSAGPMPATWTRIWWRTAG